MTDLRIDGSILLCPGHPLNARTVYISIHNGRIQSIETGIPATDVKTTIEASGFFTCAGFTDLFATVPSPGAENRETHLSAAVAAQKGGFTRVLVHNDLPGGINHQAAVHYVQQQSVAGMHFLPLANLSKGAEGKELAELYDLNLSGAAAFGDGRKPVHNAELLLKALQYSLPTGKPVFQLPVHTQIGKNGLMNEGIFSTRFGMPGIPALSEWLQIQNDLSLLEYSGGKLHFAGISTARSVTMIEEAIQKGRNVSYSLSPWHLLYADEDLSGFDTLLKLQPCLRTLKDKEGLKEAVRTGERISIASHHLPQMKDDKDCEFEYARYGMTGLQTCFHSLLQALPDISEARIATLLSERPGEVLGLKQLFAQGEEANLTLFSKEGETFFGTNENASRSTNNILMNGHLPGRILGTYSSGHLHLNPQLKPSA